MRSRTGDSDAGLNDMTVFSHQFSPPADEVPPPSGILAARAGEVDEAIEQDHGRRRLIERF
jgi:hypothetical protein